MTLKITKSDIVLADEHRKSSAVYRAGEHCPIARCLRRHKVKFTRVADNAIVGGDGWIPLPDRAQGFIQDFDNRRNARPFQMTIDELSPEE